MPYLLEYIDNTFEITERLNQRMLIKARGNHGDVRRIITVHDTTRDFIVLFGRKSFYMTYISLLDQPKIINNINKLGDIISSIIISTKKYTSSQMRDSHFVIGTSCGRILKIPLEFMISRGWHRALPISTGREFEICGAGLDVGNMDYVMVSQGSKIVRLSRDIIIATKQRETIGSIVLSLKKGDIATSFFPTPQDAGGRVLSIFDNDTGKAVQLNQYKVRRKKHRSGDYICNWKKHRKNNIIGSCYADHPHDMIVIQTLGGDCYYAYAEDFHLIAPTGGPKVIIPELSHIVAINKLFE